MAELSGLPEAHKPPKTEKPPDKQEPCKPFLDRLLDRLLANQYSGKWNITPTLIKRSPRSFLILLIIGLVSSAITIFLLILAMLNEMSGILINRPLDVYVFIFALSTLVVGAILFYPLLLVHYRFKVYFEEEVERLNTKYREGLQEFQLQKGKTKLPSNPQDYWDAIDKILEDMSQKNPDYQDFAYLYKTYTEVEYTLSTEIDAKISERSGTNETIKKEILREIFHATALENLEDTGYNLSSFTLPVSYCMITVAFGLIIIFLSPLLGTSQIQFGDTSINLVWAAGGFIGAYIYSFLPFFQRCTRKDLPPRAFLYYALRLFIAPIAVAVFGNVLLNGIPDSLKFATSVGLGSVPLYLLTLGRQVALPWWNEKTGSKEGVGFKDVFAIQGITVEYAERLHEEGIMNIQNLAFTDPDVLNKRTRLNRDMIFNWKDQAILMLLTGDIPTKPLKKQKGS